ncbi:MULTISPECIES: ROK family transcriptional regulator [unclassified Streptomyces]|uniref:ROK family transcriptional regulator n=1 Tax=unclassified Streptomyces TaxID=2593676 RepID=UPI000DB9FF48|nr:MULTISPECIES: ROK family transcriptional regulator [unclassified Streptomyces]MYT73629.1 ROK family protein [Streptomyces sp. SID8367]RAJ85166.1 putative NBD/HSP70 family sugar kinase [Streptomyces sp. PsTaAH-137]
MPSSHPMPRPSLEMLRALTDENVLRSLMSESRLTRAEIAARTGISRPTISDSVRRLAAVGLVVDTGERTTGRGRVGSYYGLAPGLGAALVVGITPHGITAEAVDALGRVRAREETPLGRDAGRQAVGDALDTAVRRLAGRTGDRLRTAVVSAADPVDRGTGRLAHLPDAPFLVGDLDPPGVLAPYIGADGSVHVDNDVNWAARAERAEGCARGVDDFVYLHLGEGLGGAVVCDGDVRRGAHGFAGEIAHLYVPGPDGAALPLTEVFAALGLRRAGSTAVDVAALRARLAAPEDRVAREVLTSAIGAVVAAAVAFADPRTVVVGGSWGPDLVPALDARFRRGPRPVPVAAARLPAPELTGARAHATDRLRTLVVDSAHPALAT